MSFSMNSRSRRFSFLLLATLVAGSSGCFWVTTKHEGKQIKKDVARIDAEVKTSVRKKVAELQEVLDKATKLLTRNSADLGAEVDTLEKENAEMRGLVMEAKRLSESIAKGVQEQRDRLDSLEKRLTELEQKVATEPQKSPEQMFAEARTVFDAGNYERAKAMFKVIAIRHSTDDIAPEAQYYRGESHFRGKDYKGAIGEFQKVFEKYPKSRRADEALFRAGESATALKWCTDARAYFGVLVQRYPKSSLVKRAKKNLSTLKKNAKNKRVCKS
jgi:tol-pal system protein YbgF